MNMTTGTMFSRGSWWMLAIRGIIALLFGLAVFTRPSMALQTFVYLFGIYALVDGLMAIGTSLDDRSTTSRWWIVLIEGLVGVVIGIITLFWSASLLYMIAIWAIVMGILEIASAFTMHRPFAQEWTMVIGGIVSAALGILLFFFSSTSVLSLLWLIGIFAIVFGVMMFARSVQFKTFASMSTPAATA